MNRKTMISGILLAAMVFSLWGCRKAPDKEKETKATTAPEEKTPEPSELSQAYLLYRKSVDGGETTRYGYNDRGFLMAEKSDTAETRYTYDEADRLIRKEYLQGEERLWHREWVYTQNKLTDIVDYEKDTEVYRETYTYDENGRLAEKSVTDGGESYQLWYRYDENGRLQAAYERKNGDRLRATYTYNPQGQLIEESWFSDTEHIMQILRTYYADGTLCKEEYRSPIRNIWTYEVYLYNPMGRLAMHLVYDRAAEVARQEYHFDQDGYLVEEIHFENGAQTYRAEYDSLDVEMPLEDVEGAALRNESGWMAPATEPDLTVFAFPFRVVK